MGDKSQWISFAGVVMLAVLLPGILRGANSAVRLMAGAEGRLAAITVDTSYSVGNGAIATDAILAQKDEGWKNFLTFKALPKLEGERLSVTGEGSWVRAVSARSGNTYRVVLANFDPNGRHSEVVPVNFIGLAEAENYLWKATVLGASTEQQEIVSRNGLVQKALSLPVNSIAVVELLPKGL